MPAPAWEGTVGRSSTSERGAGDGPTLTHQKYLSPCVWADDADYFVLRSQTKACAQKHQPAAPLLNLCGNPLRKQNHFPSFPSNAERYRGSLVCCRVLKVANSHSWRAPAADGSGGRMSCRRLWRALGLVGPVLRVVKDSGLICLYVVEQLWCSRRVLRSLRASHG